MERFSAWVSGKAIVILLLIGCYAGALACGAEATQLPVPQTPAHTPATTATLILVPTPGPTAIQTTSPTPTTEPILASTPTPVPTVTLLAVPTPTPLPNTTPTLAPTPIPTIAGVTGVVSTGSINTL